MEKTLWLNVSTVAVSIPRSTLCLLIDNVPYLFSYPFDFRLLFLQYFNAVVDWRTGKISLLNRSKFAPSLGDSSRMFITADGCSAVGQFGTPIHVTLEPQAYLPIPLEDA